MARITVVNDNPEFLELIGEILADDRYPTTTIDGDRPDTLELIRDSRPDLLMIDIRLGVEGDHGWQIAQEVRRDPAFHDLPVLLCCTDPFALREIASDLASTQRIEVLPNPFSVDALGDAIGRLLGKAAVH